MNDLQCKSRKAEVMFSGRETKNERKIEILLHKKALRNQFIAFDVIINSTSQSKRHLVFLQNKKEQ